MVAAALAVAGCGGGGGAPTPPGGTAATQDLEAKADAALKAAKTAVDMVMDNSDDAEVTDADAKVKAARTAVMKVPAAERAALSQRLGELETMLATAKRSRDAAMEAKAAMMKAEALKVHAGIAPVDDDEGVDKRLVVFSDGFSSVGVKADATLGIDIGKEDRVDLKRDRAAMVAALKGWTGARYTLEDEGTTYEAVAYDNRYSAPGDRFRVAWKDELQNDSWLNEAGTRTGNHKKVNSVTTAGITKLGELGEVVTGIRGEHSGVPGTYSCAPAVGYACAVQFIDGNHLIGGATENNNVLQGTAYATWRFRPDNPEDRVKSDDDVAHVSYGYWIRKGADGTWDVSPFHNAIRGEETSVDSAKKLTEDTKLQGTATYGGGAVGVYALSDGAGTFTADAELVADFTGNSVTGTIDGFMTKGFTGGDGTSRDDWSVELRKVLIGVNGVFTAAEGASGLTRWTMDGAAAPAAGRWQGAFYDRGGAGLLPKAATGSFLAEHGMSGRMAGAFGVTDPRTDEPLEWRGPGGTRPTSRPPAAPPPGVPPCRDAGRRRGRSCPAIPDGIANPSRSLGAHGAGGGPRDRPGRATASGRPCRSGRRSSALRGSPPPNSFLLSVGGSRASVRRNPALPVRRQPLRGTAGRGRPGTKEPPAALQQSAPVWAVPFPPALAGRVGRRPPAEGAAHLYGPVQPLSTGGEAVDPARAVAVVGGRGITPAASG